VCTAGSRLFVHKSRFDRVVEGLSEIAAAMRLGPGIEPATQIGPLVSATQQQRVLRYIESGFEEGARATAGGEGGEGAGYFVRPTVLVDAHDDMRVAREEIFGPVVVAMPYEDLDEVARRANDTPYGLAASIWSNDLSRVHRLLPKIGAGTVWVNCHNILDSAMPFGGYKQSGIGREMGRAVLDLYTESKSVIMAL
jgi:phenylacetaldehyde dehydrogenase